MIADTVFLPSCLFCLGLLVSGCSCCCLARMLEAFWCVRLSCFTALVLSATCGSGSADMLAATHRLLSSLNLGQLS